MSLFRRPRKNPNALLSVLQKKKCKDMSARKKLLSGDAKPLPSFGTEKRSVGQSPCFSPCWLTPGSPCRGTCAQAIDWRRSCALLLTFRTWNLLWRCGKKKKSRGCAKRSRKRDIRRAEMEGTS